MTSRTVTAMFNARAEAEHAAQQLASQLGVDRAMVRVSPETGATDMGHDPARPYQETGFFGSLKGLFLSEEDRFAYAEGMRRGGVLVSAQVDDSQVERAADILERAGAVDLDQQEASWRQSGWTGYDATAAQMSARAGEVESIPVIEERLIVGKREVNRGGVRVRSYVVERPVEAEVRLHEERVEVERHPVGRPLTDADRAAAFQERTIEATATGEEAVVAKEARVIEEVVVRKDVAERVETVRDTVRRTEVEVEDDTAAATRAASATTTSASPPGADTSGANPERKP
jgi:uncharacterized protein (TIGR02271 family)